MASPHLPVIGGHPQGFAETCRQDDWWRGPLATFLVISVCIGYMTWALLQGEHYYADPYLSPLYSPVILVDPNVAGAAPSWHVWVGEFPSWWPWFIPASPAALILVFPGAFRFTCYYYRKAYYRTFAGSPPGCGVNPVLKGAKPYNGENALLLFQNLHRYALYAAIVFVGILSYDALVSFFRDGQPGIGVGSLVLTINAILIGGYTFGCHSLRHLIGGGDDAMSCGEKTLKYGAWRKATWCNARHAKFAWVSLLWVTFTDFYVRMVSMGIFTDFNTWD
jgi:hypothetical protein